MAERVAVIGVGQTEFMSKNMEVSQSELVNLAVRRALENAELTIKDIDAVIISNMELFEGLYLADTVLSEGTGSYLKSGMRVQSGGTSGSTCAVTAFEHAATGLFNAVLAIGYEKQDEGSSDASLRSISEDTFFDINTGARGAANVISELAQEMLDRGSVTEEQIAKLRVKQSENASRNPHAHLRKRLTVNDVLNSRYIIPPLRLWHICPTSIGACAMIVAPESRAKKMSPKQAWVMDWVSIHGGMQPLVGYQGVALGKGPLGPMWAFGVENSSAKLYKRNRINNPRKEFDVVEVYDMSTWNEAAWYECMRLCEKNSAGKLIDEGATTLNGDIPVNPSGGVTSTNAIGASAMLRIAEAAIQIRGEGGERQVPNVKTALAVTAGGDSYSSAVLLKSSLV
jgi:acetyl-CoA C-acetyltransferase